MIQNGDNSIRDRIKSDVLQEVQRVLLTYEERIAVLEKENRLLWEENRKLCIALDDLTFSIDAFEEEMKAKINDALSNLGGDLIFCRTNLKIEVKIFRFQSPKSNLTSLPFALEFFRSSRALRLRCILPR